MRGVLKRGKFRDINKFFEEVLQMGHMNEPD